MLSITLRDGCCFRYHKGTDFQANHNRISFCLSASLVVLDTTKVQIFKQITTNCAMMITSTELFQIPQRYRFSSKSQHKDGEKVLVTGCFRYHKGTDFQANHNRVTRYHSTHTVVLDTTKVQIFKQITTDLYPHICEEWLFQIPQRYRFSSKSQREKKDKYLGRSCFRYHKGTDFQANHNTIHVSLFGRIFVLDTTKVQIFKQITTARLFLLRFHPLFQIPQRYRFSSKSQRI